MFGKLLVTLAVVLLLGSGSAQAARLFFEFGKDETLHSIQEVAAKGPNGEALVLAYKTTTMWFFGPVYMTDDGYVLRLKSDYKKYVPAKPELVAAGTVTVSKRTACLADAISDDGEHEKNAAEQKDD